MNTDDLRVLVKHFYKNLYLYFNYCDHLDFYDKDNVGLNLPAVPNDINVLTCGAKTRKGTPCKRKDLYNNTRCKLHGGLSTGPRTIEGKKRSALNGFIKKKKRTP